MKLKHIIHSQAYRAMVSRTHLVETTLDSNGLMDYIVEKMRWQKSHKPISHCKILSMLLVNCVTKNRLFKKKKKKTYCHDNDKKYFRNNIICGSFYQRFSLIFPSPSKLRHDFLHFISIKKVASLLYPSLSCKVSYLAWTFDSYRLDPEN